MRWRHHHINSRIASILLCKGWKDHAKDLGRHLLHKWPRLWILLHHLSEAESFIYRGEDSCKRVEQVIINCHLDKRLVAILVLLLVEILANRFQHFYLLLL